MSEFQRLIASPAGRDAFCREHTIGLVTKRLCELMAAQGVTQKALARRMGLSYCTVNRYLSGGKNMRLDARSVPLDRMEKP